MNHQVYVVRREIVEGVPSPEQSEYAAPLREKILEYIQTVGSSNANLLAIITQLLTQGKVRVEFEHFVERLELIGEGETDLGKIAAMFNQLYQEFQSGKSEGKGAKQTQAIIVQSLIPLKTALKRTDQS